MNANPADTVDFSTTMTASDVECVCDRATMDLMCIECKRQLHGRLYQPCDKHPQVSRQIWNNELNGMKYCTDR